jgi:hypothetical protein
LNFIVFPAFAGGVCLERETALQDFRGRRKFETLDRQADKIVHLKLGYKASAEQFGPSELLKYGVLAEECGFDSPSSAIISSRGAIPAGTRLFPSRGWALSERARRGSSWAPAC